MRVANGLLIRSDVYSTPWEANSLLLLHTHQKPVAGEGTGPNEEAIALSC